jgi:hypothetical protein
MNYELTRHVFEERRVLTATEEAFANAKHARLVLSESLFAEERFSILLENYEEFERDLLGLALRDVLFQPGGWSDRIDELHLLNRRLANLLTICRVYIHHTPQTLNNIFGANSQEADSFCAAARVEYDKYLGYRAMEAMRNYVQHKGLPIHRITNQGRWSEDRSMLEHWVIPSLDVDQIRDVGGFKSAVLEELAQLPKPVDVRGLTREYLTSLWRLHGTVRALIEPAANAADSIMEDVITQWSAGTSSPDLVGLELRARDNDDEVVDRIPILREVSKRRRYLQARNGLAGDLSKQVVTNKLDT